MLLAGRSAAAQAGHKNSVLRNGESPGYSFIATGEVSAQLHVTPASHLKRTTVLHEKRCRESHLPLKQ